MWSLSKPTDHRELSIDGSVVSSTVTSDDGLSFGATTPISIAVLAVYLPALILPYYFIDDLWLYRPPDIGFPDVVEMVMIRQGRPVFGALALATQYLRSEIGIDVMIVARALAAIALAVFACCVYQFVRIWHTSRAALCLTILLVALPSFQMYVTAGPLLAPSLAYCGFVVLAFGRVASREHNTRRQLLTSVAATIGLVIAWGTYQALPLVVVALLVPMLLSDRWHATPRWRRLFAFCATIAVSLVLYYVWWSIANSALPSDNRYSPKAIGFHVLENVEPFLRLRLPQVFGFWDTRSGGSGYVWFFFIVVLAACVVDIASKSERRLQCFLCWVLAVLSIFAVDWPLFLAPKSNTFSYMTSAPAATAAFFVLGTAVVKLTQQAAARAPQLKRVAGIAGLCLCLAAVAAGARSVLLYHVVPNWLEYALVRADLRNELKHGPISRVTIYARKSLLGGGRDELSWGNFDKAFWAHWAVRDILDELGAESRVQIDVVNIDGSVATSRESVVAETITPLAAGREVTIDLRALDISSPPDSLLRKAPPMPGYQSFLHRRSALRRSAELMRRAPGDFRFLPIRTIDSTLTYDRQSAAGERAAIDDNLETWAADPRGFHPGSLITLALHSVADVYGVRILSARAYGIEIPGKLRVSCEQDGSRDVGRLALEPGTLTVSEALWDKPCRTAVVRMEPVGTAINTNFWISEIQVIGRPVDQQGVIGRD